MNVTIFWEDSPGGSVKNFGPQRLLQQCLLDDGVSTAAVQRIHGHAVKGNGNVVAKLRKLPRPLTNTSPFLGVLDWDEAPRLAKVTDAPGYCRVREALSRPELPLRLIIFLDRNVETLLSAVCQVLNATPLHGKPNPNERDTIFQRLWSNPVLSAQRSAVRESVPSFDYLVTRVRLLVSPEPSRSHQGSSAPR